MTTETTIPFRFYRLKDVIGDRKQGIPGIIPVSRASWYVGIKEGRYPKPVKLSEHTSAWRSTDIDELVKRLSSGEGDVAQVARP
jgi:prophage regulatory protein